MRVRVLFFSLLRDLTGESEMAWELPAGKARVADLLESLYERWPKLRSWDGRILVAVDCRFAGREEVLAEGREVAIMPPVQGG